MQHAELSPQGAREICPYSTPSEAKAEAGRFGKFSVESGTDRPEQNRANFDASGSIGIGSERPALLLRQEQNDANSLPHQPPGIGSLSVILKAIASSTMASDPSNYLHKGGATSQSDSS